MPTISLTRFKLILTLSFTLFALLAFAQQKVAVIGKVIDAETNLPIPDVSVFFNNTTIGTSADSAGRFRIYNVPVEFKELTASAVGYTTLKVNLALRSGKNFIVDFKMLQDRRLLSPLVIHAKKDINSKEWNSRFILFKKIFLGKTSNAFHAEILNPFTLYFHKGEQPGFFTAHADQPLQIKNQALGYKLFVTIEEFSASETNYRMLISTRFDTLTPKSVRDKERWQKNRMETYKGSQRHLFKSIMAGRYREEGFRIYQGVDPFTKQLTIAYNNVPALISNIYADTTKGHTKILRNGIYQIDYVNKFVPEKQRIFPVCPFPVSWINVRDTFLTLAPNGEPIRPANLMRMGYMDTYRIADMLPYDFDPVTEESRLALSKQVELLSIRGTVKDENNNPLPKVEVFINNGLTHTTTNLWGQFEIPNLNPGTYPIGFAYGGKKEEIRIIDVSGNEGEIKVQLKERKNHISILEKDKNWENTKNLFEQILRQQTDMQGPSIITNPYVLIFKRSKKKIEIKSTAPLTIENRSLGYQWKYFIDSAVLIKGKGEYKLTIAGLVKMDTLSPKFKNEWVRWQSNRFSEYKGSWNDFATSLIEGRAEDEGFKTYQLKGPLHERRIKFQKLANEDFVRLKPDSLLIVQKGRFFLRVPKGLEIHYDDNKGGHKFYKGLSRQVIRIKSDSSYVPISANGVATKDIMIAGLKDEFLKRVPVDFKSPYEKISNSDVLVFIKDANLKSIRNLREKTYVQTDRSYYYPGDTIWLKAYLKYANLKFKDSLSKVLYVDLINLQNKVISNRILKITEGQASGDFVLTSDLTPGDYYLRVYTNWMINFDEFFVRPIPIISRESFIVSQNKDTTSFAEGNIKLSLTANKNSYSTREPVELALHVSDDQGPKLSSLSVSVTDLSAVAELNGIPSIRSLDNSFKATGSKMIRIKYPVEKGVTFHGKIHDAKEYETYTVAAVLTPDKGSIVTNVKGSNCRLTFDIVDTLTAVIKCFDQHNVYLTSDIQEKDSISFFMPPPHLNYELHNNTLYTRSEIYFDKNIRVLKEVFVRAKRISAGEKKYTTLTQRRFGNIDKLIEGKDILPIRQTSNLISAFNALLPDFVYTAQLINAGQNSSNPPIIDIPLSARIYSFYLDGRPISRNDFTNIQITSISRIEVYYNAFDRSTNDSSTKSTSIISIYTEPLVPLYLQKFDKYRLRGYDIPLTYRAPAAISDNPDYRPTLYWNPLIQTNEKGKATISFRSSDVDGKYKVTIEGVSSEGEFFRVVKLLTVIK